MPWRLGDEGGVVERERFGASGIHRGPGLKERGQELHWEWCNQMIVMKGGWFDVNRWGMEPWDPMRLEDL